MLSDLFLVPHSQITLRPLPEDLTSAERRVKTTSLQRQRRQATQRGKIFAKPRPIKDYCPK